MCMRMKKKIYMKIGFDCVILKHYYNYRKKVGGKNISKHELFADFMV